MIKIPDEVVEAGARALVDYGITAATDAELARAAIAAALAAWPGAVVINLDVDGAVRQFILPLPQEARDD
jgi:hypothetical protein